MSGLNSKKLKDETLKLTSYFSGQSRTTTACANYCGPVLPVPMLILMRKDNREYPEKDPLSTGEIN